MPTRKLTILIVTPAPRGSRKGNRITALRWAQLLRELGHHVRVAEEYAGQLCDLLVALHARKGHSSIIHSLADHRARPVILGLTGTDLYEDIHTDAAAQQSLELAARLIVLQQMGVEELPEHLQRKTRVIYQSVRLPPELSAVPKPDVFEVCVVGHLREVKDPLRTAWAARLLPAESRIRVLQIGGALCEEMSRLAKREAAENPRYQWLGELTWRETLQVMARCRLLVLSSRLEGGANVIGEAVTCGVPVISSSIAGSIGILGFDYPGYFPCGDTESLAKMLRRAEVETAFYSELKKNCEKVRPLFDPTWERACWKHLISELCDSPN